ncbi:hypothetical protein TNCV_1362031 [Trichonephila clavipes]|nr:hypothetical protein TNCV_1362031 [Trichonephila clavipes]
MEGDSGRANWRFRRSQKNQVKIRASRREARLLLVIRSRRNVYGGNRNGIEVRWGENYDRSLDVLEWVDYSGENCA